MSQTVFQTSIPGLTPKATGKVREIFDLGSALLIVASDRVSAYDSVMPTPIPLKGSVLTSLSRFWFRMLRPVAVNHYITTDMAYIADRLTEAGATVGRGIVERLEGRSMLVVRADMLPVECVVRGYLSGSLYAEYRRANGPAVGADLHGHLLPPGLRESDRLSEPIFTPATKAETGHDINISFDEAARILGRNVAEELRDTSLRVYSAAAEHARRNGVIIADTKFEFGFHNGVLTLADEVLTPDSSRFWDMDRYDPGKPQPSFDKQYLRDWLETLDWDKTPPGPELPGHVVARTRELYLELMRRLTGREP